MTPDYYVREIKGVQVEVKDIADAWDLDRWETQALQYLLRSNYKDDVESDLKKCKDCIQYALDDLEKQKEQVELDKTEIFEILKNQGFFPVHKTEMSDGTPVTVFKAEKEDEEYDA